MKYEPTKGTDTINKNGMNVNISTLHHCITASAQYMSKSLEVRVCVCVWLSGEESGA